MIGIPFCLFVSEETSDEDTLLDTWEPTTADESLASELAAEHSLEAARTLPAASSSDSSDGAAAGTNATRPKGYMGVLDTKLTEENDARTGLLQEECDLRVQLLKQESPATVEAVRLQSQAAIEKVRLETEAILHEIRLETQLSTLFVTTGQPLSHLQGSSKMTILKSLK